MLAQKVFNSHTKNPSTHYFVEFQNLVYMHVFPSGVIQEILFSFPSVLSKTKDKVFLSQPLLPWPPCDEAPMREIKAL